MRFADPHACPDCRGAIAGQGSCPHCGFDLSSIEARQLWQTLLQADDLLARAGRQRRDVAAPAAVPSATPAPMPSEEPDDPFVAAPSTWRPYPTAPAAVSEPPRSWSVGTVLLVLGALGLIVAGLIFVTRSWQDIGLAGRTLILLGVTAVVGSLGTWVTRRPLRASAEAVWSVFLALLTLDFFAARHEDLAGLGVLDLELGWVVWGVVALALSVAIALWARPHVTVALVAPAVAGGLAITLAGIGAGAVGDDWDDAWRTIVALVVAGLLALSTRPAGLAPLTLVARAVVGGFFAVAYVAAFVELVLHPQLGELVGGTHGLPLLLVVGAAVVVAWIVPVARVAGAALAVLGVSALAAAPVLQDGSEASTWTCAAVIATVLVVAGTRGTNDWGRGLRIGAVPAVGGLLVVHGILLVEAIATVADSLDDPWQAGWSSRLDDLAVDDHVDWAVPVVLVALAAVTWCLPRWPELSALRPRATDLLGWAAALGAVEAVVAWRLPLWAVAVVLLGLAAVAVALHARSRLTSWAPPTAALVAAAVALTRGSEAVFGLTAIAGALLLTALAALERRTAARQTYAFAAVALGMLGAAALADVLEVDESVPALVVVAGSVAVAFAAQVRLREHPVRVPVEVAAAVAMAVALVTPGSSADIAVRWTLAGVGLIALSAVSADRRRLLWPGLGALVVAYVALIIDSGFSFVEAYTLPLGAAGLGVGVFLARSRPTAGTWTLLGPGLAVALLPSVPQALVDPTDLRALLLGVGAAVVLAVGVRLHWQAPFVAGTSILALLIVFNIGPYANAAPRVVLIAALGAVSMGLGITWEDRVRDGRRIVHYVRSLR